MKDILHKFGKRDFVMLCAFGIMYALLLVQYIPYLDDLFYTFVDTNDGEWKRVECFRDALDGQIDDYFSVNGRFIVHLLVMCFCGFVGHIPFYMLSTFFAVLLVAGLVYMVRRDCEENIIDVPLLSVILFCIPTAGLVFLSDISFNVNYLWGACFTVWFLIVYLRIWQDNARLTLWQKILLSIFALLCGHWQESFSLFVGGSLFIYHIFNLKKTKGFVLCYLICYAIGILTILLSPANFKRTISSNTSPIGMIEFIGHWSFVVMLVFIVLPIILEKRKWIVWAKGNCLYYMAVVLSYLFAFFVAFTGEGQQLTLVWILCCVLFCKLLKSHFAVFIRNNQKVVLSMLIALSLFSYPFIYVLRDKACHSFEALEQSMVDSTVDVANSHELEMFAEYEHPSSLFESFVTHHIKVVCCDWPYNLLLHYEGVGEEKSVLPDTKNNIAEQCVFKNEVVIGLFDFRSNPNFFIVKSKDKMCQPKVEVAFKPVMMRHKCLCMIENVSFIERKIPFSDLDLREFEYNGCYYYIIRKPFGIENDLSNLVSLKILKD